MFAMNDGYSDYDTLLLGKTTIQATKIDLFLSMHIFQLAFFISKILTSDWLKFSHGNSMIS